ncbi:MAG: hypothetical protein AB4352_04570 [Hormoscilla sp.]
MPEDANNNHPQQPEPPVPPLEPWSMEADADRLMEDLFQDVDRVLDGGTSLPKEPVQPEYLYLQPMDMQSIGLKVAPPAPQAPPATQTDAQLEVSSALTAPVETSEEIEQVTGSTELGLACSIPPSDGTSKTSEGIATKPVGDRSVKKLLLLLVSTCLGVPLLLWLGRQSRGQWQWQSLLASGGGAGPSREEIQARIEADADAQFASYMQQTLASIDQNAQQRLATLSEPPPEANSFSGEPVRDRQLPVPNRVPTVLERVYIPVYQPPRPASPSSPLPLPPPPPSSDLALLPPPPPSSDLALPPPPDRVASSPISLPAPPPVASNATQILVGILELGDRSAALFDIDGVTHRFRVGEDIGDSGWTLVEISQQEAIVRRNGQLRSIYVGQKL